MFGPNSNSLPTDVPGSPLDINVTDVFQTSCIVHWKPPKDDGGSPILNYVVERQDLSLKGGWGSVAEIANGQPCTFKCEDLSHKKEYKFRVKAVNKMGASEPATFNKTILAKDPWGKKRGFQYTEFYIFASRKSGNIFMQFFICYFVFTTQAISISLLIILCDFFLIPG